MKMGKSVSNGDSTVIYCPCLGQSQNRNRIMERDSNTKLTEEEDKENQKSYT